MEAFSIDNRPSLKAIETFVVVSEEGSISGGAHRLATGVSTVSVRLSNLEQSLGTKLIQRNAQRFELTDAGKLFKQRALRILDELDGAATDLISGTTSPLLTFRLAVVEDFDNHIVPLWLNALRSEFPDSRFVLKSGPSHQSYSALTSRSADMIVAVDTMDPVDWIEEHPLMRDPYMLVTSKQVPEGADLSELLQYPFIRYSAEQQMGRQIETQLRRVRAIPPKTFEMSTNQALFAMVAARFFSLSSSNVFLRRELYSSISTSSLNNSEIVTFK